VSILLAAKASPALDGSWTLTIAGLPAAKTRAILLSLMRASGWDQQLCRAQGLLA
jgi:hypothetical protein